MKRSLAWVLQAVEGTLVGSQHFDTQAANKYLISLEAVTTDSRQCKQGSTYLARIGEEMDGHNFVPDAVHQGADVVIVEREVKGVDAVQIRVEDATLALGDLARAHLFELRKSGLIQVAAVTGSAGKTTTKDLLARVLSMAGPTVAPILSFNNEVGCPTTVLQADQNTRYLMLEMGASGVGHITYLTEIAPLDVAVVLLVGRAHLGGFGSVENLAAAKGELVQGLVSDGKAVLNYDDQRVSEMKRLAPGQVFGFSPSGDAEATFRADNVKLDDQGRASFTLTSPDFHGDVTLRLTGRHQVSNALAALTCNYALGLPTADAVLAIEGAVADSPHRMDIRRLLLTRPSASDAKELASDVNSDDSVSIALLDDSYNANPDSLKAAFPTAKSLQEPGQRLVMVLGEMLELGDESETIHAEVGVLAADAKPDRVILVGPGARGYNKDNQLNTEVTIAEDPAAALEALRQNILEGDLVLIKGSYGSGVWKVADLLIASSVGSISELNENQE